MSLIGLLAVGSGAVVGAWLRWWLGVALNPIFPTLPHIFYARIAAEFGALDGADVSPSSPGTGVST